MLDMFLIRIITSNLNIYYYEDDTNDQHRYDIKNPKNTNMMVLLASFGLHEISI